MQSTRSDGPTHLTAMWGEAVTAGRPLYYPYEPSAVIDEWLKTHWLVYAEKGVAPMCRKPIGLYVVKSDAPPIPSPHFALTQG